MPSSTPPRRRACARPPTSSSCSRNCAQRCRSPGRIALLAFVARQSVSDEQPEGNHFSQSTGLPSGRRYRSPDPRMAKHAGMLAIPQDWTRRVDAVTDALAERHGTSQTWQLAERQSPQIADLLCLAPAAGEQKFSGATALGDELFLSATQPRDMSWSVVALSVSVAGRRVSRRHGQGEARRAARPPVRVGVRRIRRRHRAARDPSVASHDQRGAIVGNARRPRAQRRG